MNAFALPVEGTDVDGTTSVLVLTLNRDTTLKLWYKVAGRGRKACVKGAE